MLSPQAVAVTAEPDGRSAPEVSLDARVRRCRVGTTGNRGQFRLHTGLMVPFGDGHPGYPTPRAPQRAIYLENVGSSEFLYTLAVQLPNAGLPRLARSSWV